MSTQQPTEPQRETVVVDGSEMTDAERDLVAKGLDDTAEDADTGAAGDAGGEGAAGADAGQNAAAQAAADAAAQEQAAAAAAAAEQQAAAAAAAAAHTPPQGEPLPAAVEALTKPEPPVDFDAEFDKLKTQLDAGDIDSDEYDKAYRALGRQEAGYEADVRFYQHQVDARERAAQDAAARADQEWNAAAVAFEADAANKELLSNPLRAQAMQQAIQTVDAQYRAAGRVLAPGDLLSEAARITREAFGIAAPAGQQVSSQEAVRNAVGDRKPPPGVTTLGDVPTAGREAIRGNEAYAHMDGMGIEDLEAHVQGLSPDAVEKYLRDAPGANSHGRGNDE